MANLNQFHLNGLRATECVLRLGSLQKAADALGVTPSAVSQQIGRTEAQLGRKLFERTPGGLTPTAFAIAFGRRLSKGFDELSAAVTMGADDNNLVITVAPVFASRWLMPRLMRHFRAFPDVLLRVDASPKLADLDHSDAALAIGLGKGDWPQVKAELLFAVEEFPVCAPEIAKGLKTVNDLANASLIHDDNTMLGWNAWFAAAGAEPVIMNEGARFSDPLLVLESVLAGHGVMLGWDMLVGDALRDGRLVAPFGVRAATGFGYYVCTSARREPDRKTRNFINWLKQEVAASGSEGQG